MVGFIELGSVTIVYNIVFEWDLLQVLGAANVLFLIQKQSTSN